MTSFEELLVGFVNDVERGREGRIQRNIEVFGLCHSDAELLDELSTGMTLEVARLIGKRVDNVGHTTLKAAALLLLPQTTAINMAAMSEFLEQVTALTAFEGRALTVINPNRPDCPCENCQLARAASELLAVPHNTTQTRH